VDGCAGGLWRATFWQVLDSQGRCAGKIAPCCWKLRCAMPVSPPAPAKDHLCCLASVHAVPCCAAQLLAGSVTSGARCAAWRAGARRRRRATCCPSGGAGRGRPCCPGTSTSSWTGAARVEALAQGPTRAPLFGLYFGGLPAAPPI
jgi:hypothetical protein